MPAYRRLPSLKQLRHFVALSDHLHFGNAADACFITQSSLSTSIKELEATLDKELIERTKRSVMVTPLGKEVAARARKVLTAVEEIVDLVAASNQPLSGALRLGVIPTISPFLLPRVLPALRRAYPELKLYLREETSSRLVKRLANGDLDLLLLAFPYPTEGIEVHLFADDPFLVAFAEGHGFTDKDRIEAADLKNEEPLLLEEGNCLRNHAITAANGAISAPVAEFAGSNLHTLVQMVDNGLGLTLLPKIAVDTGITKGTRVQFRPLEGKGTSRQIGLAWRPSSPRKEEFLLLADFFRDELAMPLPSGGISTPPPSAGE